MNSTRRSTSDKVSSVLIVGGGDVGLLTALGIRKKLPEIDVRVVDDFGTEVPQVGKSTYLDIQNILHRELDIQERRFIEEVKPIWKATVFFRDWCGNDPFHYPFDISDTFKLPEWRNSAEHLGYYYDVLYDSSDHQTRCEQIVSQRKTPWYYQSGGTLNKYAKCAYHLNSRRFNNFLRTLCQERGVSLVDDEITHTETTGTHIDALQSNDASYDADLFVDATGFNRVLRSEQNVPFRDFDFPLDTAFNVRLERDLDDVIPATVVESGDYGWFWHIDTYDNRDLGYVFASEYVDNDTALTEFREFVESVSPPGVGEGRIEDGDAVDTYRFTSGYYDRGWVDNCLAIGNAGGFVEPLQSTALTTNAALAMGFAGLISGHGRIVDDDIKEAYNRAVERGWESIYDFIAVHYRYSTGDTELWEKMASMEYSDRLDRIAQEFDRYGYDWTIERTGEDGLSDLRHFNVTSFFRIMRSLGATSDFYESNSFRVSDQLVEEIDQHYQTIERQVDDQHVTTRQFYKDILN